MARRIDQGASFFVTFTNGSVSWTVADPGFLRQKSLARTRDTNILYAKFPRKPDENEKKLGPTINRQPSYFRLQVTGCFCSPLFQYNVHCTCFSQWYAYSCTQLPMIILDNNCLQIRRLTYFLFLKCCSCLFWVIRLIVVHCSVYQAQDIWETFCGLCVLNWPAYGWYFNWKTVTEEACLF